MDCLVIDATAFRISSAPGPFCSVAHAFKFGDNSVSMIALDFNPSVFDSAARAKLGLQLGGKFGEALLIER